MNPQNPRAPLFVPDLHLFTEAGLSYAIDAGRPNWIALEERGRAILDELVRAPGGYTENRLVPWYATRFDLEPGRAWLHVRDFVASLRRAGMVAAEPFVAPPYPGRHALIAPEGLRELWIQVNNACNLTCSHCLVSSGPGEHPGLPGEILSGTIASAAELGLERLYLTGGEPFVRRDIFDLIRRATDDHGLEVIVLTNGTVFQGRVKDQLTALDRERVRVQVSVDGARPDSNDPVRGPGAFKKALDGARLLTDLGFQVSLSTVVGESNLAELAHMPEVAHSVGASSQHLMWAHRRGRAESSLNGFFPAIEAMIAALAQTIDAAERFAISLDNLDAVKRRVNGVPGIKYDYGNGGWDSLCLFIDGKVYPTAALVGDPRLVCGDIGARDLAEIFSDSPALARLRQVSLANRPDMRTDPLRFFTGGGDWEHAFWATGDLHGRDPYYPIAEYLVRRVMTELGQEKLARGNRRSGYDAPLVLHAMGQGALACATVDGQAAQQPVLTLHSNCVLSFDVDKPRAAVREYYGAAAEVPQADLCCPTSYDPVATDHIPEAVLERFYGCGSPMASAGIQPGETVVDLGSGAGIDVFIAARLVGPGGRAIGVDMTEEMLAVARANQPLVAEALGYDVVAFERGFLEAIPLADRSVDLVTSNCVINLSPDKPRVFEEIWRILADHGRINVSDIVSDRPVPAHITANPALWGECLAGALTQDAFLAELERAGFYGLTVLSRTYWKQVEGHDFYSVTVRGYKFEKTDGCVFMGQRAVYLGPGKAFVDEEGHVFARNEPLEICTDTAAKLRRAPYADMFAVLEPGEEAVSYACCAPDGLCC